MPRWLMLILFAVLVVIPTQAQDDEPTDDTITYGAVVSDTITDGAFFDFWRLQAEAGDIVFLIMTASDGLAPLLYILDEGRNLVARSDGPLEGPHVDATPNETITLEYGVPAGGEYLIGVGRVGRDEGTSTGSYTLEVRRANPSTTGVDLFQDVVFSCIDFEAVTAATLELSPQMGESYRISIYGFDGFDPVMRIETSESVEPGSCQTDSAAMGGDQITLPGEATITLEDVESPENAARVELAQVMGDRLRITVGSREGTPGRYLLVIDGLTVDRTGDVDLLDVWIGPRAAETTDMLVYMLAVGSSRLDPLIEQLNLENDDEVLAFCDDAGRRGCEDVPGGDQLRVIFGDGEEIIGNRFSAGLRLAPGSPDPMLLQFRSRNSSTGGYAIAILGSLPALELAEETPTPAP
jgi:hypothetical protein